MQIDKLLAERGNWNLFFYHFLSLLNSYICFSRWYFPADRSALDSNQPDIFFLQEVSPSMLVNTELPTLLLWRQQWKQLGEFV